MPWGLKRAGWHISRARITPSCFRPRIKTIGGAPLKVATLYAARGWILIVKRNPLIDLSPRKKPGIPLPETVASFVTIRL